MKTQSLFLIGSICFFASCTTYLIPLESFKQQFAAIDSTKLKDVEVRGPAYELYRYKANPITKIKCVTKDGAPVELTNGPAIEMRVTYSYKHKRKIFYFDRVMIYNNQVVGSQSRFVEKIRAQIPLDSITKIEVQNGGKRFYYN